MSRYAGAPSALATAAKLAVGGAAFQTPRHRHRTLHLLGVWAISGDPITIAVGVKALDAHTLQVRLNAPTPYFIQLMDHQSTYAVHRPTIEKFGKATDRFTPWTRVENIVGNGPFRFVSYQPNDRWVFEANPSLRVVRVEGVAERTSAEESDAYFASRPLDSRIGAWASPQSQVIPDRAVLVTAAAKYGARFLLHPPRPPQWGGYRLKPDTWQFWQGRKSRLHDRLRYTLQADGGWLRERLAP